MEMTFRWYGNSDPVTLEKICQIPGMHGIVSAIYDIPVGEEWPREKIRELKNSIEKYNLKLSVIESVPVHEDIKLGKDTRDKYIQNYINTIRNLGAEGIKVICYNFMPVFDWTRTDLAHQLPDGSNALIFDEEQVKKMDPVTGELSLPGWDSSYTKEDMKSLLGEYADIDDEKLWANLEYFIKKIIPVAEEADVKMAIHPDDPPWSIFGLPRIITNKENLERFINLYDSPNNGLTLCAGSLGASSDNDTPSLLRYFLEKQRVNFVHARNVKITGPHSFEEASHLSSDGSIDMYELMKALSDNNYTGPIRPDHGRMIWGETGKPGYGLYDRALGVTYLNGLWEALQKSKK